MKIIKKFAALLLLVMLTVTPFSGCGKDPNYMPCPIFEGVVYYAESTKSVGYVEYPYYTVYVPEESKGMYIMVGEDGQIKGLRSNGVPVAESQQKYLEIMDGYKIIKLFDLMKAAHFYHYDKDTENGIHMYYIDLVFDNADGSEERLYVNTDEYGYIVEIKSKDGKFHATFAKTDIQ